MASYDIIKAAYATTAVRRDQYPEGNVPEVAFLGRSNVGKSSLINSLCNHRGLARVSGAPGKTQTINYFSAALRRRDEEEGEPAVLLSRPAGLWLCQDWRQEP
jgi:GTP-binding protein